MSSETEPKTIELWGVNVQHEATAGGTITPGMLVQRSAADTVAAHGTAGGTANLNFAVENRDVGGSITDDYASGDQTVFVTAQPGSAVYALANAAVNSYGTLLTSAGNGKLKPATTGNVAVAQALETVGQAGRIRVEVISAQTVA